MRLIAKIADMVEAQRATLLLWMPLALGSGIGTYFSLRFEPGLALYAGLVALLGVLALLKYRVGWEAGIVIVALMLAVIGFLDAGASAHRKSAPVLKYRYYGPVEGRVTIIDRSSRDLVRITLDRVVLAQKSPDRTPRNIRISLHYPRDFLTLKPGMRVALTANLSPPSGPTEPGGFDFQRFAWFKSLGAIGYSRTPVLEIAPPDDGGFSIGLMALRMRLAEGIRAQIPGQKGAFAAAILTGDRSAIAPNMLQVLRNSNLAHLLAISGLHMGLLTGFVFAMVRYGLSLLPFVALRLPVRKIAAIAALIVATGYLLLSGGNVATQRAFVMVGVMLLAILMDRRALTLRAVALAAVIVLLLHPESLIQAGFQMSFAATTALVSVFSALNRWSLFMPGGHFLIRFGRMILTLMLSSAVAGAATAPFSAFNFNQIAQYGLLANLLSVPMMGFLVMPSAVIAILLTPLGLSAPFWTIMGGGIAWILAVATQVASLDGAIFHVMKPASYVLILIALGALVFILLRGRVRFIGAVPVVVGFILWQVAARPDILIAQNGQLVGVMTPTGRWLSRAKGSGFVAGIWLKNDGDPAPQDQTATRLPPVPKNQRRWISLNGVTILLALGKKPARNADPLGCDGADILIAPRQSPKDRTCRVVTANSLKTGGAIAITLAPQSIQITNAREVTGIRLWSPSSGQ